MSKACYRGERGLARDLEYACAYLAGDMVPGLSRRQLLIANGLQLRATPTQMKYMYLYYAQGMTLQEIGRMLGVHVSTVSRTIARGVRWARIALMNAEHANT